MTTTRKDFLGTLGATLAFGAAGCRSVAGAARPQVALQLYSIHGIFWREPVKCLTALKAAGYDGVEFYDAGGKTARELRAWLDDAGLKCAGVHVNGDVALVGDETRRTFDFWKEVGADLVTTPHAKRDSAAAYRTFGRAMGAAADAAVPYGIRVGVHSTYHHFTTKYGAATAWDEIYREASPRLCQQIDTGNTFHVHPDLLGVLRKYHGRHASIHLKENVPTLDGVLGTPPTDGGPCVPWADVIGYLKTEPELRWWIVEAEGKPASLEPAAQCRARLAAWL